MVNLLDDGKVTKQASWSRVICDATADATKGRQRWQGAGNRGFEVLTAAAK
ncbi:MAG: hypothetical protein ACLS7Q_03185 [Varibaculum cambriense]